MPPMKQQPSRSEGLSKTFWWDCWVWVTPKTPRWDVDEPRGRKIIKEESNSPVPVGVKNKNQMLFWWFPDAPSLSEKECLESPQGHDGG
jgi:hypothetical protein